MQTELPSWKTEIVASAPLIHARAYSPTRQALVPCVVTTTPPVNHHLANLVVEAPATVVVKTTNATTIHFG